MIRKLAEYLGKDVRYVKLTDLDKYVEYKKIMEEEIL